MARRNQLLAISANVVFGLTAIVCIAISVGFLDERTSVRDAVIPAVLALGFLGQAAKDALDLPAIDAVPRPVRWGRIVGLYAVSVGVVVWMVLGSVGR